MIDRSLFTLPKVGMALGVLLVFSLAEAACIIGEAYTLARAITNLWEGGVLADQLVLIGVFAACFIGKQLVVFARDTFMASFSRERTKELRGQLLEEVFGPHTGVLAEHGSAALTQAALDGIEKVEVYLSLILPKIIGVVAVPLPVLIAIFLFDWVSGVILLVLFPIIIFYMILLGRQASARAAAQYKTYNALSNHFIDTLRGLETLKSFGQSKKFGKRIFKASEDFRFATIETLKTATLSSVVLDLIATLGVAAVAMMLGFRLLDGILVLFPALMVLVLAPEYFKPIREFAGDFHASLDGKNALVAINKIVSSKNEEEQAVPVPAWNAASALAVEGLSYRYGADGASGSSDGPSESEDSNPTVEQEDGNQLSASEELASEAPDGAPEDAFALHDVNLKVHGFAKVGIVGMSGSGKTTLINVLGGFIHPNSGTIEANGAALRTLQQADWQRQLLYIPQNPYIFHATLRENICFYSPQANDQQIENAVEVCGLSQLIESMPHGLDTIIGEAGRGLSGGQAQRIALARAMLDPSRKVLLFDEPTAHLDIETELELKERMLPLMENRLVFFATHRLHWLLAMDYILVMEEGRIVEQGTLDQLLAKKGKLVQLASMMNRGDVA